MALSGIGSQPIKLSDVVNLKIPKTKWVVKLIFQLTSIEATKSIMLFWVMTPKYCWPISLQDFLLLTCKKYWDFWRIANSDLNNIKSAAPPLFNGPEVFSDKAKLFAKNFSMNSNLDDLGISLPDFPSRTNLKCLFL